MEYSQSYLAGMVATLTPHHNDTFKLDVICESVTSKEEKGVVNNVQNLIYFIIIQPNN